MKIQQLILGTLGYQLSACGGKLTPSTTGDCEEYAFELSTEVTLDSFMFSQSVEVESCEELCSDVYEGQTMADVRSVESCDTTVDLAELSSDLQSESDTGNAGDTGDTEDTATTNIYGTVDCAGTAIPMCMGRRPMGHIEHQTSNQDLGNHFANCAYLEAASVDAFIELAEQLRTWGAPADLIQRCLIAAEEERNHTQLMDGLAKMYGGHRPVPSAELQSNTSLFEVALHNAVEGCIHEAWAACVAMHQAIHADVSIKRIYTHIAKDEIEHAQLSWDLHEWFHSQLSENERHLLRLAQLKAIEQLQSESSPQNPHATFLGLSVGSQEVTLRRKFSAQLAA